MGGAPRRRHRELLTVRGARYRGARDPGSHRRVYRHTRCPSMGKYSQTATWLPRKEPERTSLLFFSLCAPFVQLLRRPPPPPEGGGREGGTALSDSRISAKEVRAVNVPVARHSHCWCKGAIGLGKFARVCTSWGEAIRWGPLHLAKLRHMTVSSPSLDRPAR